MNNTLNTYFPIPNGPETSKNKVEQDFEFGPPTHTFQEASMPAPERAHSTSADDIVTEAQAHATTTGEVKGEWTSRPEYSNVEAANYAAHIGKLIDDYYRSGALDAQNSQLN